jgi:23S rRNA (guanine745-N1)-methyltransferase
VAPLAPRPGHRLRCCPVCWRDLAATAGALACRSRHSFDLAREGYVNLLPTRGRHSAEGGDRPEQLTHRATLLDAGHFDFITAAVLSRLRQARALTHDRAWHVLDAGCGTGHHLARIAVGLGLGLDIAPGAAHRAARRWPSLAFAVADLWREWPVQDAALDLVISLFAPNNFTETARVLRPGGWFALVYPRAHHLVELRRRYALMRHRRHKAQGYVEAATRTIGPVTVARFIRRTVLDPAAARDAVLMGPATRHITPSALDAATGPMAGHVRCRRTGGVQSPSASPKKSRSTPPSPNPLA